MALLGAGDVMLQLAREALRLDERTRRVFTSYVTPHAQWSDGIHLALDDVMGEAAAVTPAERSALFAMFRHVSRQREVLRWDGAGVSDAIRRALWPAEATTLCAMPLIRGGRIVGVLVVAGGAPQLDALRLLCDCAASALDNAVRHAAAKRDQERLYLLASATGDAIWDWNLGEADIWWGGGIRRILGDIAVEPTLEWKLQRIAAADREQIRTSLDEALRSSASTWSATYRMTGADGFSPVVEDRAFFLRDETGKAYRVIGYLRDVTQLEAAHSERNAAQDKLATERAVLRSVFMNAPACICVLRGPELVFELANPPYRELLQNRPLEGLPAREAIPELEAQGYFDLLDHVYRSGEPFFGKEMPSQLRQQDGSYKTVYFNFVYQPLLGPAGTPDGIIAFGFDVTDQVLARKQVEETHRITDAITSNATLGLFLMDARQHCTFMNPAAERMTGFTLAEVQGKPLHEFVHHTRPDGRHYPIEECPIDRALPTQHQQKGEDVFVHEDGHFYPVAFTASPILEGGEPIATVIEVRDTTVEKAAQQERERILSELSEAIAARDEFLSIASHELRTPLTPLQLQLDSLKLQLTQAGMANGRVADKLELATRQCVRLTKLVDHLLDVSRIQTGQLHLELEPLDLARLVEEVVARSRDEAQRAGSTIVLASSGPVPGTWDRMRMEQLVGNLLSNAIKYGNKQPIEVRVAADGERATIAVRDHGIGIDHDARDRIFARFERAVSIRNYGGLGLGLYIARQIVEAHRGSISVESEPGAGSVFTVVLPREPG